MNFFNWLVILAKKDVKALSIFMKCVISRKFVVHLNNIDQLTLIFIYDFLAILVKYSIIALEA